MPQPKQGDSLKATTGKTSQGIKTFESMGSTTEPPKEENKEKKQENNGTTNKEKNGRKINKEKKEKNDIKVSKRSTVKEQNLWAWKPDYKITTAIPFLGVIGLVCSIIGIVLFGVNSTVKEVVWDYTDCKPTNSSKSCHELLNIEAKETHGTYDIYYPKNITSCQCHKSIDPTDFGDTNWIGNVFLYYGLNNFHQNHRMYVKSRDNKQLQGDMSKIPDANTDIKCTSPFDFSDEAKTIPYFPCGAIANSLFNDTITLQYKDKDGNWKDMPIQKRGIAHPTDKEFMFKNPPNESITSIEKLIDGKLETLNVSWPKDWGTQQKKIWITNDQDKGFLNEDFIVWMRIAANPNFRKLYGIINQAKITDKTTLLLNTKYRFKVEYNYNAKSFGGKKKVILSTVSFLGGKSYSEGTIYFLTGIASILTSIAFVIIKKKGFLNNSESTV